MLRGLFALSLGWMLIGCGQRGSAPAATPTPQAVAPEPSTPRCIRAGGRCVGPAAIAGNPAAPCAAGMHRVDDVKIPGGPAETRPACYGIPHGEEACCMPN